MPVSPLPGSPWPASSVERTVRDAAPAMPGTVTSHLVARRQRGDRPVGRQRDVDVLAGQALPGGAVGVGQLDAGAGDERRVLQRCGRRRRSRGDVARLHGAQRAHPLAAGDARIAAQLDAVGLVAVGEQIDHRLVGLDDLAAADHLMPRSKRM